MVGSAFFVIVQTVLWNIKIKKYAVAVLAK